MNLPTPRVKLAGCLWLARIITKARLLDGGLLPPEYEARFCHPSGVDGQFLGFFGLGREEIVRASRLDDDGVAQWFVGLPAASSRRIEDWNQIAVNLGRPGFPMADRLAVALSTTYKHLADRRLETVFEVLEEDERSPSDA